MFYSNMQGKINNYIQPDHEILNWEKWVIIRNEEIVKLAQKTRRPPADMVMNLLEKVREEKEEKIVLQNAQIETKPTLRGFLWEQPERLKQRCYCEPVYELHRKCEEMGQPPVIEHVGVPKHILENEKGIFGVSERNKSLRLDAQYHKYKEKREEELKVKIKKLDPYRSEISELLVKGNKPKTIPKPFPTLPELSITPIDETEEIPPTVYAVRINNTVLIKAFPGQLLLALQEMQREKWHESCSMWSYYFNVPVKRVGRAKVFLQNLGTVTLRYSWQKVTQHIPFIPADISSQTFFFNKNEDILSPGQSREILFTFISTSIGIYNEIWELSFGNVSFFEAPTKQLLFNLQADSVEDIEKDHRKIDLLKVRINRKAVRKLIRSLLNDAVNKASSVEPQTYPYKKLFLEGELFVMKNPVCYYHQTEVTKLKDNYTEMMPSEIWDLSISTWRNAIIAKCFEDRMKYYEVLKLSHSELLKPWDEGDDLLKQKHCAVKLILSKLADEFEKVYLNLIDNEEWLLTKGSDDVRGKDLNNKYSITSRCETQDMIHKIFYMRMYNHLATAIETCAGVVSSLDRNRWIQFDFCQKYH